LCFGLIFAIPALHSATTSENIFISLQFAPLAAKLLRPGDSEVNFCGLQVKTTLLYLHHSKVEASRYVSRFMVERDRMFLGMQDFDFAQI